MMPFTATTRLMIALTILGCELSLSQCQAGSGGVVTLPQFNGKKVTSGIIADVDCRWTNGSGYRPVRVTLTARKANRDRTIRVVLLPESWSSSQEPLAVSAEITIPEGEKKVTKTILVPQYSYWNNMRATFYEGGRKLKDLSMDRPFNWNTTYTTLEAPCLLLVDGKAPSKASSTRRSKD